MTLFSCHALFVDTDLVPASETFHGNLPQNEIEAALVCQTVETLVRCGVSQADIGVVSVYRQQLKVIRHTLEGCKDVELLTADKSQGRDLECIIISMVRSNDGKQSVRRFPLLEPTGNTFFLGWRTAQRLATN